MPIIDKKLAYFLACTIIAFVMISACSKNEDSSALLCSHAKNFSQDLPLSNLAEVEQPDRKINNFILEIEGIEVPFPVNRETDENLKVETQKTSAGKFYNLSNGAQVFVKKLSEPAGAFETYISAEGEDGILYEKLYSFKGKIEEELIYEYLSSGDKLINCEGKNVDKSLESLYSRQYVSRSESTFNIINSERWNGYIEQLNNNSESSVYLRTNNVSLVIVFSGDNNKIKHWNQLLINDAYLGAKVTITSISNN